MTKSLYIYMIELWFYNEGWLAEISYSDSKDGNDITMKGKFSQNHFRGLSLTESIDEVLEYAKQMNIQFRDKVFLLYNEADLRDEEPNFPPPPNYTEAIKEEAAKRGWVSFN